MPPLHQRDTNIIPTTTTTTMTTTTKHLPAAIQAANQRRLASNASPRRSSSNTTTPLVVESSRYEEWMKIATDNKITATNTWSLALIDYFHDMSLLRNTDQDNSINFQKASCTLDGCVKIWTSRVDSVALETGKLLSGLQEDHNQARNDHDSDDDDDGGEGGEGGGDDGEGTSTTSREKRAGRKKASNTSTLAPSFASLRLRNLELEFSVDPLFKKTSADFDEGGAGGILMNHLGCDGTMRVVFDAGDAKLEAEGEGEGASTSSDREGGTSSDREGGTSSDREGGTSSDQEGKQDQDQDQEDDVGTVVDLRALRSKHLPLPLASLQSYSLCPSLASFRFSHDNDGTGGGGGGGVLDLGILNIGAVEDDEDLPLPSPPLPNDDDGMDWSAAGAGGAGAGGMNDENFERVYDDQDLAAFGSGLGLGGLGGAGGGAGGGEVDFFALDSALDSGGAGAGGELLLGGGAAGGEDSGGPGPGEQQIMFDYFDAAARGGGGATKGKGGNWAGPEHWKLRRVVRSKDDSAAPTATAKQRKEKVAFAFDFTVPPPISQEELFTPASTPASIRSTSTRKSSLPSAGVKRRAVAGGGGKKSQEQQQKKKEEDYTLPDDHHFNSQVLLRLFLKPKTGLKMRRRPPASAFSSASNSGLGAVSGSGELDATYWAQPGAHNDDDLGGMDPLDQRFGGDGSDEFDDAGPVPFDTQLLGQGDDDDLPYFNEDDEDEPDAANAGGHSSGVDGGGAEGDEEKAGGGGGEGAAVGGGEGGPEEEDMLLATQGQLKRVRPENINYAKRAKRVDVKKLKDSIWRELEEVSIPVKEFPSAPVYQPSPESQGESLLPVVSGLRRMYPKDKMDEISTSFCFICLLHLANEKGLRIQTPAGTAEGEEDDGLVMRKSVGGLEGLRVYKQVEA